VEENQKKYLREEYLSRINRVIDYIEQHIDETLSLAKLAEVANFSRFHFHRLFKAIKGETLNQYISRMRTEKAATQLLNNPKKSITEIALDCGFSGSAAFARAFKDIFKMSASEWRIKGAKRNSNIRQADGNIRETLGNIGKDLIISSGYIDPQTNNPIWRIKMKTKKEVKVEVKELPELNVAYVRHTGPYKGDNQLFGSLIGRLMKWAAPRDLLKAADTRLYAVYHDDPNVTQEENLRMSICISVPKGTPVDGEIGQMTVPGGKFAVAGFELANDEFEEAWGALMGGWLPESGYQPDDRLCYEIMHNDPQKHPEHKHVVDICVPVRPM
jgi:AraC family transcriptional regulator